MANKRPDPQLEEPALFDLPLHPEEAQPKSPAPTRRKTADRAPEPLSLFPEDSGHVEAVAEGPAPAPEPVVVLGPRPVPPAAERPAPVGVLPRVAAGLSDLSVHVAVAVILYAGCRALGLDRSLPWPPLAICLLLFSFVYFIVPLAFWGNTPGMALRGLQARARGGEPLTFGQAFRRWLGTLLTALFAGLPVLAALRGRSLADLLSGSTVRQSR